MNDDTSAYHELLEAAKVARDELLTFGLMAIWNDLDLAPQGAKAIARLEFVGARLDMAIRAVESKDHRE